MYWRVVKMKNTWAVKDDLNSRIVSVHRSRKEAIDHAIKMTVTHYQNGQGINDPVLQRKEPGEI